MRIDKYIWAVRYLKTRNMATQACKKGSVRVNGDIVKPSRDVYPGDTINLRKNQINYELEVLDLPESRVGAKLVDLYRKDTTPKEAFETNEMLQYAKTYYRKKGVGRPTKKDRRDLDDFTESTDDENEAL
ncbi:MAG TPA: RNA-binding S4 domain-containing protein [Aequorivita sp.]|jgi:ribosome-associated heat shock protein Hsp15|uniref:RNA-binding protein n=1 Tax=Aequorivita aquimaris TaxID=1548749 RepID=A0A137RG11_9FLAO|nr:RNA-binding S4 domain-containing protein [Aequorivita aquimaris]KXN98436.1 RNA-binding protein [Aequorivita aquimaris]MCB0744144.1 RNA-binding S4 domain-containing protein [Ignavibacteriota bacterium]HNP67514.1 RNA-binding S4 domain-containing protein [Aequorivita sp.]|tara:strand:+ start:15055 stop:15444 length:390 start_codon:yes stop_codon:yes gene_type:complete